jgi:AcrR family transcriptional regulator
MGEVAFTGMAPRAPAVSPLGKDLSERERELLNATIEVLDEHGYDRLTVDEVAARAHASKATIYRRWPSKAALIIAAVAARIDTAAFAEPMHDVPLRDELLRIVRLLTAEALEMHVTIAGLIGEAIRNEELRASLEEHFVTPRRDAVRRLLERRQAAGEIRADVDIELVGPITSALVYQRLLITFEPVDDTLPEQIVNTLLLPLLT